jgi:cytoskeletal protein RodZ
VSIGETLARARMRAGLSVANVSQRTRIRESLIRAIEADDYSGCGGDFYARGHIRSIASAVGTDPEPLVWEYDKNYRAPQEITAADAFAPVRPIRVRERDREREQRRERAQRPAPAPRPPREPGRARERRRRVPWPMLLLVALVVVIGLVGYLLVAGSSPASHTPQAASHPATHHPSSPAPTPSRQSTPTPSPTPTAAPPPPASRLNPAGVTTFGPNGGDNAQLARHAIDGSPGSAWHSDWYTTADFGGLQHGTGLLLNMGRQVTITAARITVGGGGTSLQLRAGNSPSLGDLKPVAHAANANGVVNLHLPSPAHGRYVLIWITKLPPDSSGTYQARVSGVRVSGRT